MAMVNVVAIVAYRWTYWLRLIGLVQRSAMRATFVRRTGWTLAVAVHCYDDSTINIVVAVTITTYYRAQQLYSVTATQSKNWAVAWHTEGGVGFLSSGEAGTTEVLLFVLAAGTADIFRFLRPRTTSVELNASMNPLLSKISGATQHTVTT